MAERPDQEKLYKTAEFKCSCGHGWISIRSLGLPEKCKECNKKGVAPTQHREATHQEQLQGKKMIMVAKYKCDRYGCGEKWKKINSSGRPQNCPHCKNMVKPYKYRSAKDEEQKAKRKFGFFHCKQCDNEWPSAYTWVGKYQKCRGCNNKVYAHAIQPLKPGRGTGKQKPHDESRCQKCQELGRSCRSYTGDEDVDFPDDQSITSVASSTSTEASAERDDVTPTVSDDEDQVDEHLEDKLKNLKI